MAQRSAATTRTRRRLAAERVLTSLVAEFRIRFSGYSK